MIENLAHLLILVGSLSILSNAIGLVRSDSFYFKIHISKFCNYFGFVLILCGLLIIKKASLLVLLAILLIISFSLVAGNLIKIYFAKQK